MDTNALVNRMIRAARLDVTLYEEVEHDQSLTQDALTVVIITAVAAAISGFLGGLIARSVGTAIIGLIVAPILAVIGYFIWSYLCFWIGTKVFNGTATYGELLRTIGFAMSPNVAAIVGFIPCLGPLITFVASIWALVCAVVAIRQALDFDTGKAIVTAIIGWIVQWVVYAIVFSVLGLGAMLVGGVAGTVR